MLFTDKIALSGTRRTGDGYLVADAKVARTGIQIYLGREVGKPEMEQVRVYRAPEQVFADEAMASFAHRPVTNDHPPEAVNAQNWKRYSVGQTGDEVKQDGKFLRIPMVVMDQAAINDIEAGKSELSNGYGCDLDWTPGTTPDGEAYDAMQIRIRGNHVAIVKAGRAGPECRIGDSWADVPPAKETHMTLKTVTVDGIPIEVTDQGATVIATLQSRLADAKTSIGQLELQVADGNSKVSAKDGEIVVIKQQLADALEKLKPAAIDALVLERSAVIADAKVIMGRDPEIAGKTNADIRRDAVAASKVGDKAKEMDDAAIAGAFDALRVSVIDTDPVRNVVIDGLKQVGDARQQADEALSKSVTDLNAWRKEG